MAGNENMKVYISFCSPLNRLNILKSLVILNTLNILAIWGSAESDEFCSLLTPAKSNIISSIEALTTKKSNIFHADRK